MVGGLPEAVAGAAGVVGPHRAVRSERRDRGPSQIGGKTPDQERAVGAEQVPCQHGWLMTERPDELSTCTQTRRR